MVEFDGDYTIEDEGDYDLITVESGELTVTVGGGDTFENVLIDQTQSGTSSLVHCSGDGWEVNNIGIDGTNSNVHGSQFVIECLENEDGTIRNVCAPDGGVWSPASEMGTTGVRTTAGHDGHATVEHCFFGGWPDVAIDCTEGTTETGYGWNYGDEYGMGLATADDVGSIDIHGCYFEHCGTAAIKTGLWFSTVTHTVIRNMLHRGIWVINNTTFTVDNCEVNANGGSSPNRVGAGGVAFELGDTDTSGDIEVSRTKYGGRVQNVRRRLNSTFMDHGGNSHNVNTTPNHGTPTTTEGAASGEQDGVSSTGEEYEVIEINPGERRYIDIDSGETFSNKLIDVTASDCAATLVARGTDWTIENIGWSGRSRDHTHIACEDTGGGTSVIRNVYIGDGAQPGHRNGLGVFMHDGHNGHLLFDGVNIQEMGDNSFYLSTATNGTVELRNCYSKDSWVAHYRVGSPSLIQNCVAVNTSEVTNERDGRGLWSWAPGPCEVRNCHFAMNGRHYSFVPSGNGGGRIHVHDTEWDTGYHGGYREPSDEIVQFHSGNGNNPQDFVPEGCPTSAEQAASGGSSGPVDYQPPEFHRLQNVNVENTAVSNTVGVRAIGGRVEVFDSEIAGPNERETLDGGEIASDGTNWGSNANPTAPRGVPMSPTEASGRTPNGSDPDENR